MKKVFCVFLCFFSLSYSYISPCSVAKGLCRIMEYNIGGEIPNQSEHSNIIETVTILNFCLKKNQKIKLVGHTDSFEVKNKKKLSYKRAKELEVLLKFYGLREDIEIELSGVGSTENLSRNNTPEGRYFNRRVEILFRLEFPQNSIEVSPDSY